LAGRGRARRGALTVRPGTGAAEWVVQPGVRTTGRGATGPTKLRQRRGRECEEGERELGQGREGESSAVLFIEREGERRGRRGKERPSGVGFLIDGEEEVGEREEGGEGEENTRRFECSISAWSRGGAVVCFRASRSRRRGMPQASARRGGGGDPRVGPTGHRERWEGELGRRRLGPCGPKWPMRLGFQFSFLFFSI
jgi:hypothetical protein